MSKIISLSVGDAFASGLENLMKASGYANRSRFLRDAAIAFADLKQRGELADMAGDTTVEGHLIIYFQHECEQKLMEIRHTHDLVVNSYNHNCLSHSHACVDVMHAIGRADSFRATIEILQNIPGVDKVHFAAAPNRDSGCC